MSAIDDLASALRPPAGEDVASAQGTIVSFDTTTFRNVIRCDGMTLRDVDVGSGFEALTYQPGQVVLLKKLFPGGAVGELGAGTVYIDRRIVTPGDDAAEQVIAPMRTSLVRSILDEFVEELLVSDAGRTLIDGIVEDLLTSPAGQALARFVIAQGVHTDEAAAEVSTSSSSYVSLSGGPSVSSVPVSESGVALVWVGARATAVSSGGATAFGQMGAMGFVVSGATSRSASDDHAFVVQHVDLDANSIAGGRAMAMAVVTGLNEGNHTFASRYRVTGNTPFDWSDRAIAVIGL